MMNKQSKRKPITPENTDSGSDSGSGSESKKRKIYYDHKFQLNWLDDSRFSPWIIQSNKCTSKSYCTACEIELSGSVTQLERHVNTEKHKKNVFAKSHSKKVTNYFQHNASKFEKEVASAELKMCAFISEHNLPTSIMDHLPGLIANVS